MQSIFKNLLAAGVLSLTALALPAFARDTYVNPYVRSDGTYVQGHHRTTPNDSRFDNYSTPGQHQSVYGRAWDRRSAAAARAIVTLTLRPASPALSEIVGADYFPARSPA